MVLRIHTQPYMLMLQALHRLCPNPPKVLHLIFFFTLIDGLVGCVCMCATVPRFDGEHSPLLSDSTGLRKSYL